MQPLFGEREREREREREMLNTTEGMKKRKNTLKPNLKEDGRKQIRLTPKEKQKMLCCTSGNKFTVKVSIVA